MRTLLIYLLLRVIALGPSLESFPNENVGIEDNGQSRLGSPVPIALPEVLGHSPEILQVATNLLNIRQRELHRLCFTSSTAPESDANVRDEERQNVARTLHMFHRTPYHVASSHKPDSVSSNPKPPPSESMPPESSKGEVIKCQQHSTRSAFILSVSTAAKQKFNEQCVHFKLKNLLPEAGANRFRLEPGRHYFMQFYVASYGFNETRIPENEGVYRVENDQLQVLLLAHPRAMGLYKGANEDLQVALLFQLHELQEFGIMNSRNIDYRKHRETFAIMNVFSKAISFQATGTLIVGWDFSITTPDGRCRQCERGERKGIKMRPKAQIRCLYWKGDGKHRSRPMLIIEEQLRLGKRNVEQLMVEVGRHLFLDELVLCAKCTTFLPAP